MNKISMKFTTKFEIQKDLKYETYLNFASEI